MNVRNFLTAHHFFKCNAYFQKFLSFLTAPNFLQCAAFFQLCCIFLKLPHSLKYEAFSHCIPQFFMIYQTWRIFPKVPHCFKYGAFFQMCCFFPNTPHFSTCLAFFQMCRIFAEVLHFSICSAIFLLRIFPKLDPRQLSPFPPPPKAMMKAQRSKNTPFWHHWSGGRGGPDVPFILSKIESWTEWNGTIIPLPFILSKIVVYTFFQRVTWHYSCEDSYYIRGAQCAHAQWWGKPLVFHQHAPGVPGSNVGWVCCWFSPCSEGFSPGSPVFLPPNKFQFDHDWRPALIQLRPSPFFFVYCRMRFLILGRSVGKRKKKAK